MSSLSSKGLASQYPSPSLRLRPELLWFYQEGASILFPDHWEDFVAPIPKVERGDLIGAFYRRLTGDNKEVRQ